MSCRWCELSCFVCGELLWYYGKCQHSQWLVLQEFGEDTKRLMCWPHTSKNIDDNLVILQRESKNPELAQKIKTDIDFFQWATTETEYETNFKVLVEKYTKEENVVNYTSEEEDATVKFFKLFLKVGLVLFGELIFIFRTKKVHILYQK